MDNCKHELNDVFKNLEGQWKFSRKIFNRTTQTTHHATGEAVFRKKSEEINILHYQENGILLLSDNEKTISFHRNFIYQLENGQIRIVFDDGISKGKLYQTLLPEDENGSYKGTEHLCINDIYQGSYSFPNKQEFSIVYDINGPNKNWKIETKFKKEGVVL